MGRRGESSGKFMPPENGTVKKDVKIVLHRQPFIDKTNMSQVPSDLNKDIPKKTRNKENSNDLKKSQVKSRTVLKKLDDIKLQCEMRVNVNILPSNAVPDCTKVSSKSITRNKENVLRRGVHNTSLVESQVESIRTKSRGKNIFKTKPGESRSNEGARKDYKLHHDSKFNLRCVVRLEKFDINNLGMKSANDVINTVQEVQNSTGKVCGKSSLTTASKNDTQGETSHANHQRVTSKVINEEDMPLTMRLINQSTSRKCLRKQAKKNYAEMSLEKSQEITLPSAVSTTKVPIYKSQQSVDKKTKERTDVYVFDESDSDKVKSRKNKNDCNKSEKFDKSMHKILKKIEMKEAKLQAKNKRKVLKEGRARKRNNPVQEVMKKIMRKISVKNKPEGRCKDGIVKVSTDVPNVASTPELENKPENENNQGSLIKCSKSVQIVEGMPEHEIQIPDINSTSVPEDDSSDDSGEFFDFAEAKHSTPVKLNPNINIISNITLKEINSDLFDNLRPCANSTTLPSERRSPWRYNENLKRNPHFITIKRTALPCLQQDMVLDYAQLEKSEHISTNKKKPPKKPETPKKMLVQKSIRDFMNVSPGDIIDKENIPTPSLFDYHEFSPKKLKPSRDISKNNVKRNILGPRRDNLENIQIDDVSANVRTVPSKELLTAIDEDNDDNSYFIFDNDKEVVPSAESLVVMDENNDVHTYFGFDDDSEIVLQENKYRASEARPYRINQVVRRKRPKEATETEVVEQDLIGLEESHDLQVEADGKEIGLFEDPEQAISLNVPSKIYERKRRRKRLKSVDVDEEENPPKKKNVMTKKEEDEFEKWAAMFNSECEEIEKYNLEVE